MIFDGVADRLFRNNGDGTFYRSTMDRGEFRPRRIASTTMPAADPSR